MKNQKVLNGCRVDTAADYASALHIVRKEVDRRLLWALAYAVALCAVIWTLTEVL